MLWFDIFNGYPHTDQRLNGTHLVTTCVVVRSSITNSHFVFSVSVSVDELVWMV
jgi:hypothetical protein